MRTISVVCGLVAAAGALTAGFTLFGVVGGCVAAPLAVLAYSLCQADDELSEEAV